MLYREEENYYKPKDNHVFESYSHVWKIEATRVNEEEHDVRLYVEGDKSSDFAILLTREDALELIKNLAQALFPVGESPEE